MKSPFKISWLDYPYPFTVFTRFGQYYPFFFTWPSGSGPFDWIFLGADVFKALFGDMLIFLGYTSKCLIPKLMVGLNMTKSVVLLVRFPSPWVRNRFLTGTRCVGDDFGGTRATTREIERTSPGGDVGGTHHCFWRSCVCLFKRCFMGWVVSRMFHLHIWDAIFL